jgi:mRNA interferase HigB
VHVIAAKTLRDYALKYKDPATWLMTFLERVEAAKWSSIADLRRIYPHADAAKVRNGNPVVVFNACGNSYCWVTAIHFNRGKVCMLRFLTHAEFDKDLWKDHL